MIQPDGSRYLLIDDTETFEPVDVASLPTVSPVVSSRSGDDPLASALAREQGLDRRFSLSQVRNIAEVRALAPAFDVSSVTFASGSAAIAPEQAPNLNGLAQEVLARSEANPREVFLVEGHTDAVGDAALNLALSDRRAESLALALNEYFGVPVENMVVQGYGESFLMVPERRRPRRRTAARPCGRSPTCCRPLPRTERRISRNRPVPAPGRAGRVRGEPSGGLPRPPRRPSGGQKQEASWTGSTMRRGRRSTGTGRARARRSPP